LSRWDCCLSERRPPPLWHATVRPQWDESRCKESATALTNASWAESKKLIDRNSVRTNSWPMVNRFRLSFATHTAMSTAASLCSLQPFGLGPYICYPHAKSPDLLQGAVTYRPGGELTGGLQKLRRHLFQVMHHCQHRVVWGGIFSGCARLDFAVFGRWLQPSRRHRHYFARNPIQPRGPVCEAAVVL